MQANRLLGLVSHCHRNGGLRMKKCINSRRAASPFVVGLILSLMASDAFAQTTIRYVHTDALGSPVAYTDANGDILEEAAFDPYGQSLIDSANDEPGFAGHVTDENTGLSYMQQRYYDPQIGRFLSTDPVTAYENTGAALNRYWYASNNPYSFVDPDGRTVEYVFTGGVDKKSGMALMAAMSMSQIARNELRQLEESKHTYTIIISNTQSPTYDPNTRRVWLNPVMGLRIASTGEIQTPDVNSAHEISHPAEHDRLGDAEYHKSLTTIEKNGVSKEENRASALERKVGEELGVPTRQYYRDVTREHVECNKKSMSGC